MNRTYADIVVGIILVSIMLVGVLTAVQFARMDGGPMGHGGGGFMPLVGPIIGSLVMASLVGAAYVVISREVFAGGTGEASPAEEPRSASESPDSGPGPSEDEQRRGSETPPSGANRQLLSVLPEDERRILEPVLETPGLTQVAVRDRSGFSKSKVSQTVTDLESRGLLYRERQGRTYRVYPADDIEERV